LPALHRRSCFCIKRAFDAYISQKACINWAWVYRQACLAARCDPRAAQHAASAVSSVRPLEISRPQLVRMMVASFTFALCRDLSLGLRSPCQPRWATQHDGGVLHRPFAQVGQGWCLAQRNSWGGCIP
jgi:hypothetical protein